MMAIIVSDEIILEKNALHATGASKFFYTFISGKAQLGVSKFSLP